jgi:hypothetical protein
MSVSRHHADWLSLVEVSGPFVSLPVLMRVFPQGLEPRDPVQAKLLREAYAEWQDNPTAPGRQRAWVMHVLTAVLGYPQGQITEGQTLPAGLEASMPEMGETLRPDFVLVGPTGSDTAGHAHLLITTYPAEQALGKPVIGKHWKATPTTRMMELLHGAGVPVGLITNGEQWMLVYAPRGETTGYASWYGDLWLDEPITLRAFHSLLGVRRFFGVAADNTLLALLKESANDQQEVTDQLGYQVREAVEVLVQSLDALDKESNRTLLKGVSETALYDAALTIMMRLVYLFSAEERDLLHLGKPLYDDNYAVSTLQEQLQEVADRYGEEVLERRSDAWVRLLATFRAVHGGIQHQDLLMQAYGGSLFDPDRYPFLEGRTAGTEWRSTVAEPLTVNNRVVLHLLNSLQRLRIKAGTGGAAETRRVSFRALGVEQISHVYEGLLDHTAVRAAETVLGIRGSRGKEAEIPLATLESLQAQGQDKLIEFLKEETGRSVSALRRTLEEESLLDEHKLLIACGQDETLLDRLRPFVGLIREDSFERPLVVLPGSIYITVGTTRRSTGTHYTPPSLTEPIVQYTLEQLVYEGPAEGWPRDQWKLKSPKAILDLKVCDMTMGSGAFLVQACRYLADRLVEAWENAEKQHPGEVLITPDGKFSEGSPAERLVPADANERIAIARRVVADRCLYGVDINPMAVEMAKLSLWLITVDRHRPFTFLDHAFKCGDSLLGITSLEQLENFSLRPGGERQHAFATFELGRHIEEATTKRKALEALPSDTPEQIAAKAALYAEALEAVAKLSAAADVLIAVELTGRNGKAYDADREISADAVAARWNNTPFELEVYAGDRLNGNHCIHWPLLYPEIIDQGGFDALVGNPPFVGGKRISTFFGETYAKALQILVPNSNPNADISAKFHLRAFHILRLTSSYGLLATDRIAEGETREGGLEQLTRSGGCIYRAENSKPWPGDASVRYSAVHIFKGDYCGMCILDGKAVSGINSSLMSSSQGVPQAPKGLKDTWGTSYVGCAIQGAGFIVEAPEAAELLAEPANAEVVRPFLIANDLNHAPNLHPTRWVINFEHQDLAAAARFPRCLDIVKTRVKPHRDTVNRKAHREKWWQFGDRRPGLSAECSMRDEVIACAMTTVEFKFARVPADWVFDQTVVIIAAHNVACYAVLESGIHKHWAYEMGAGFGSGGAPRYNPSRCFETFPFPIFASKAQEASLAELGDAFHDIRQRFMLKYQEGLTKTYNRINDPNEKLNEIIDLRHLHAELDRTVINAYGWNDLDLSHGFHNTKHGTRYTTSETTRRKVLDRLLALNHRLAEEEAELHVQPTPPISKRGRTKKDARDQILIEL